MEKKGFKYYLPFVLSALLYLGVKEILRQEGYNPGILGVGVIGGLCAGVVLGIAVLCGWRVKR